MVRATTDFVDQTAPHQNLVEKFSAEGDPTVTLSSLEDDQNSSLLSDCCESRTQCKAQLFQAYKSVYSEEEFNRALILHGSIILACFNEVLSTKFKIYTHDYFIC